METGFNQNRWTQILGVILGTVAAALLLWSCQAPKQTEKSTTGKNNTPATYQQLVHGGDTTLLLNALKGTWHLDRTCISSFAGLKCDSSHQQDWLIDSLGGIHWTANAEESLSDQIHFVKRTGQRAGANSSDAVWVLYLTGTQRGFVIQNLSRDSLQLANYPLIMDATTSYHLHRGK